MAEAWRELPSEEHEGVWHEAETNFWKDYDGKERAQIAKVDQQYQAESTKLKVDMGTLTGKRNELSKTQERVARELAAIEQELAQVQEACDDRANRLNDLEAEYRLSHQEVLEKREQLTIAMTNFFREKRGLEPLPGPEIIQRSEKLNSLARRTLADEPMEGVELTNGHMATTDSPGPIHTPGNGAETLVNVIDADGNVIGPVERIEPWNQWVEGIQDLPVQRQVMIRRGRRFGQDHLSTIYERTEAKGVKWLSCMIQAIGEIQTKRCVSCDKNQGAFEKCIIVGGELFPKCGNCEWNRQGCHGASREGIDMAAAHRQVEETKAQDDEKAKQQEEEDARRLEERKLHMVEEARIREMQAAETEKVRLAQEARRLEEQRVMEEERQARQIAKQQAQERREAEWAHERSRLEDAERRQADEDRRRTEELNRISHANFAADQNRRLEIRHPPLGSSAEQRDRDAARLAMDKAAGLSREPFHSNPALARPTTEGPPAPRVVPSNGHPPPMGYDPRQGPVPAERSAHYSAPGFHGANHNGFAPVKPANPGFAPVNPGPTPANSNGGGFPAAHSGKGFTPASNGSFSAANGKGGFTPANSNSSFTPANTSSGFTPANARSRPPSHDTPTPTVASVEPSPQPEPIPDEPLEEITRENLVLKHDGKIYTHPRCMYGVPLEKVHKGHWYWEESWQDVKSLIEPHWMEWKRKYEAAVKAADEGRKHGSSKYQIGRQVNRGAKIFEFLDEGEISPYQLLGKPYVQTGKGGITSYDTLFRLSETLSALEKFKLDITPVEWLRHRLWELFSAEGSRFNLSKTIHDFYRDPKLSALRHKHGFKNIGRPSGMGVKPRQSMDGPADSPSSKVKRPAESGTDSGTDTPVHVKRPKSSHSKEGTPRGTPIPNHSPLVNHVFVPPETPASAHLLQRKAPHAIPGAPDPNGADFSDADSVTGTPIERTEFRLSRVKTRLFTSSPLVTQYWAWVQDEIDNDRFLLHQILKPTNPPSWHDHTLPINFTVRPSEIDMVAWNKEAMRVHLVVRQDRGVLSKLDGLPRGDIMAEFKRERTLMRFVEFCRRLDLKMINVIP